MGINTHTYIRICVCVVKVTVFGTSLCDLLHALESQEWVYYSSANTYIPTYLFRRNTCVGYKYLYI